VKLLMLAPLRWEAVEHVVIWSNVLDHEADDHKKSDRSHSAGETWCLVWLQGADDCVFQVGKMAQIVIYKSIGRDK
jgi:hypothetical protein